VSLSISRPPPSFSPLYPFSGPPLFFSETSEHQAPIRVPNRLPFPSPPLPNGQSSTRHLDFLSVFSPGYFCLESYFTFRFQHFQSVTSPDSSLPRLHIPFPLFSQPYFSVFFHRPARKRVPLIGVASLNPLPFQAGIACVVLQPPFFFFSLTLPRPLLNPSPAAPRFEMVRRPTGPSVFFSRPQTTRGPTLVGFRAPSGD